MTLSEFADHVREDIERQVDAFWPSRDFRREYRLLLTDQEVFDEALRDGRNRERTPSVEDLMASLPRRPTVFPVEDLAALCYLDHLLKLGGGLLGGKR
jgi:hypothetical protein